MNTVMNKLINNQVLNVDMFACSKCLYFIPLSTLRTSCRSCCGSMQVSIRSSRSMMADVPMCLIIKSTKSSCFRRKSTIYKHSKGSKKKNMEPKKIVCVIRWQLVPYSDTKPSSQPLTCSGLRPISIDRTLEKKLANSGLRGGSFWRKPYSFINNFSSSPSLSLIWLTSDVSSSHDMLGYLEETNRWSLHLLNAIVTTVLHDKLPLRNFVVIQARDFKYSILTKCWQIAVQTYLAL